MAKSRWKTKWHSCHEPARAPVVSYSVARPGEDRGADALAVQIGAVVGAQVFNLDATSRGAEGGVPARDLAIVEHEAVSGGAADDDLALDIELAGAGWTFPVQSHAFNPGRS